MNKNVLPTQNDLRNAISGSTVVPKPPRRRNRNVLPNSVDLKGAKTGSSVAPKPPRERNRAVLPTEDDLEDARKPKIVKKNQRYILAAILAILAAGGAAAALSSKPKAQPFSIKELVDKSMKNQFGCINPDGGPRRVEDVAIAINSAAKTSAQLRLRPCGEVGTGRIELYRNRILACVWSEGSATPFLSESEVAIPFSGNVNFDRMPNLRYLCK